MTINEIPSHNHQLQSITGYDDKNFINGSDTFLIQNSDTTIDWPNTINVSYKYDITYGTTGNNQLHNHGNTGESNNITTLFSYIYVEKNNLKQ